MHTGAQVCTQTHVHSPCVGAACVPGPAATPGVFLPLPPAGAPRGHHCPQPCPLSAVTVSKPFPCLALQGSAKSRSPLLSWPDSRHFLPQHRGCQKAAWSHSDIARGAGQGTLGLRVVTLVTTRPGKDIAGDPALPHHAWTVEHRPPMTPPGERSWHMFRGLRGRVPPGERGVAAGPEPGIPGEAPSKHTRPQWL